MVPGIEFEEDPRHIAATGLVALGAVLVVEARDEIGEGKTGADAGAEGRAKSGADDGGGEAFAGDVGHGHDLDAIGKTDDVDAVSADFEAGAVADGDRVAGDLGHVLGHETALNGAGGVEVLLDAGPGERAAIGSGDHQFGDMIAIFIVEGKTEAPVPRFGGHFTAGHARFCVQRTGQLELAHDDTQDGGEDFLKADGGVDLARSFEQRLETHDLLLQIESVHGWRGWHWCRHDYRSRAWGIWSFWRRGIGSL